MGLDIRMPLGLLFLITGGLMLVYGLVTHGSVIYTRSLGVNVNLDWGIALAVFGAIMLALSRRKTKPVPEPVEGTAQPLRRSGLGH